MTTPDTKGRLLKDAGYAYNFDREIYFNRKTNKVFSVDFIENNSEDELTRCIQQNGAEAGWRFFFNSPPSEAVRRELTNVLG